MLWVDKYRPTNLRDMSYHEKLSTRLERLAAGGDFPHLLFYGPSGAGKKTRVMALLKSIYGNGVNKVWGGAGRKGRVRQTWVMGLRANFQRIGALFVAWFVGGGFEKG